MDHALTCTKHTGAIGGGHDHIMHVSAQLAHNSGLRVRVDRKVDTTTSTNSKQEGDVHRTGHVVWHSSI